MPKTNTRSNNSIHEYRHLEDFLTDLQTDQPVYLAIHTHQTVTRQRGYEPRTTQYTLLTLAAQTTAHIRRWRIALHTADTQYSSIIRDPADSYLDTIYQRVADEVIANNHDILDADILGITDSPISNLDKPYQLGYASFFEDRDNLYHTLTITQPNASPLFDSNLTPEQDALIEKHASFIAYFWDEPHSSPPTVKQPLPEPLLNTCEFNTPQSGQIVTLELPELDEPANPNPPSVIILATITSIHPIEPQRYVAFLTPFNQADHSNLTTLIGTTTIAHHPELGRVEGILVSLRPNNGLALIHDITLLPKLPFLKPAQDQTTDDPAIYPVWVDSRTVQPRKPPKPSTSSQSKI